MTQGKNSVENGTPAHPELGTEQMDAAVGHTKDDGDMLNQSENIDEGSAVVLDERIQAQIGQQLSSFYRDLVNQPIPQNFIDLLSRLDSQEDGK